MTEPERKLARRLIDQGRRRRIEVEEIVANENLGPRVAQPKEPRPNALGTRNCLWCGDEFMQRAPGHAYCTPRHADHAWRKRNLERVRTQDRERHRVQRRWYRRVQAAAQQQAVA